MPAHRDRFRVRPTIACAAWLLLLAGALPAQGVEPSARAEQPASTLRTADSLAFAGDTAGAIALLDAQLRREPRDAGAWYRRGMLAWGMTRAERRPGFMKNSDDIRRLMLADSALRLATAHAPDSARFWVGLGRFYLNSNLATTRFAAQGFVDRGLQAARRASDRPALADAADEQGMVHWRRYETVGNRRTLRPGFPPTDLGEYASRDPRDIEQLVNEFTQVLDPPLGDADYETALQLFTEAATANPNHRNALRHVFMALADRGSWTELRAAAAGRLRVSPWDPQAWLAAGLAAHRLHDDQAAAAAFDSALVFLTAEDRERYTRISRILRPRPQDPKSRLVGDSGRYAQLPPEQRGAVDRLYWMLSDPLTLTPQNEHRLEFLSRVTYAELRWTSDDLDLKGADTDRGDIHIRYGPPPVLLSLSGGGDARSNTEMWMYGRGLSFVFDTPPTWGTARFAGDYADFARRARAAEPVRWDNLPINKTMDSISVLVARFRAGPDSTDVFLAADVPVTRLARGLDLTRAPVDVDFKFFDAAADVAVHDSTRVIVSEGTAPVQLRAWRNRVGPGTNVYRVEALQPDALAAARAMGSVTSGRDRGFGLSDVLLAERVSAREGAAPNRWSDFAIRPSAGTFRRGQTIDLLWETYDLRAADGGSRYRVAIILDREGKTGISGLAARVVGGMSDAVGRSASGDRGRVTLRYDRAAPARPTVVDHITLDLTTASPGRYNLTIEVTDVVANTRTSRRASLEIVP